MFAIKNGEIIDQFDWHWNKCGWVVFSLKRYSKIPKSNNLLVYYFNETFWWLTTNSKTFLWSTTENIAIPSHPNSNVVGGYYNYYIDCIQFFLLQPHTSWFIYVCTWYLGNHEQSRYEGSCVSWMHKLMFDVNNSMAIKLILSWKIKSVSVLFDWVRTKVWTTRHTHLFIFMQRKYFNKWIVNFQVGSFLLQKKESFFNL